MVFTWLSNPIVESHPMFHMIEDYRALSKNSWTCEFRLVKRSPNNNVDMMAKKGQSTEGACLCYV